MRNPRGVEKDPGRSDLETLYARLNGQLGRVVRRAVDADDALIEDACQVAWGRFFDRQDDVNPDCVLAWLSTTAIREARLASGANGTLVSLDEMAEASGRRRAPTGPSVEDTVTLRQRLHAVDALPERQRRLVWLHGFGLSYTEIAGYTGDSRRTVERQLLRAKRALRAA